MPLFYHYTKSVFTLADYADIMVNPVTVMGDMSRGIAKDFSERFPGLEKHHTEKAFESDMQAGQVYFTKPKRSTYTICNMITMLNPAGKPEKDDLRSCLLALKKEGVKQGNVNIVMPFLGGFDYKQQEALKPLYKEIFTDYPGIIVVTQRPSFRPQELNRGLWIRDNYKELLSSPYEDLENMCTRVHFKDNVFIEITRDYTKFHRLLVAISDTFFVMIKKDIPGVELKKSPNALYNEIIKTHKSWFDDDQQDDPLYAWTEDKETSDLKRDLDDRISYIDKEGRIHDK